MIDAPSTNWNSTKEFYICTYACIYNYIYIYIVYRNWPLRSQRNVFGIRINSTDQPRPAPPTFTQRLQATPSHLANVSFKLQQAGKTFGKHFSPPKNCPFFRLWHSKVWRFAVHVWCVISADRCVAPLWNAKSPAIHSIVLTGIFSFSLTISIWLHSWGRKCWLRHSLGWPTLAGLTVISMRCPFGQAHTERKRLKNYICIFFWNCFNFSVLKNR